MASILDSKWRYRNSEDTRKPGYLARRFADIRREYLQAWDAAHAEKAEREKDTANVITRFGKKARGAQ